MKITHLHSITFDTSEIIMTAALANPNEIVILTDTGNVYSYSFNEQKTKRLFSVVSAFTYEDGGFDIHAPSTIYTLDSIVVIVNDYKCHGYVHYSGKYQSISLIRKDYHAAISSYPIALFKDDKGSPYLIYGVAWNHLQIMNLDTRQVLTASKSLIEVGAEEGHLKFYENHDEDNKFPWPNPYDYFYGKLNMSPNNKHFISAGWVWGSYDLCSIYEVEHFIADNRILVKKFGGGEHLNRPICWIDNETVAIIHDPCKDPDEEEMAIKGSPHEVHFYNISENNPSITHKLKIPKLDLINSKMYFNTDNKSLVFCSTNFGITLMALDGKILYQNQEMTDLDYNTELGLFIKFEGQSIFVYELNE